MKRFFTIIALFVIYNAQAQRLEKYVPINSDVVIQVNGDQIFNLMSEADMAELLTPEPMKMEGQMFDISQYGFDNRENAYYFYKRDGDIGYHTIILPVNDVTKISELIVNEFPVDFESIDGYSVGTAGEMAVSYNDNMAILVKADVPKETVTLEELQEEWRLENEEILRNDSDEEPSEEPTETDVMLFNMLASPIYSETEMNSKQNARLAAIRNISETSSVSKSKSFQDGKHKKSSAYLWLGDIDGLYQNILPQVQDPLASYGLPFAMDNSAGLTTGIESLTANLIFDKDEVRLSTVSTVNDDMKDLFKKMYCSKMDKTFYKYFDEDDMLAYMNFTTDTEKVLESYPEFITKMYGAAFKGFQEEIDISSDLLSIIIDEEEIGELLTGDVMMILHGLENQMVTYTDYEYDEDFNRTEVEKTKNSELPIFTIMIGSENQELFNKLLRLGVKHNMVTLDNLHFKLNAKALGSPFDVFATVQDDIVFITNSPSKVKSYSLKKKVKNLGKHKKLMKRNLMNVFIDTEKAIGIGAGMIGENSSIVQFAQDNYKDIHMTVGKLKKDKLPYDIVLTTNKEAGNSLRLLFATFEEFTNYTKKNNSF